MKMFKCYSAGPAPRTARGKRRHADRSEPQKLHAELVWGGGYDMVKLQEIKEASKNEVSTDNAV